MRKIFAALLSVCLGVASLAQAATTIDISSPSIVEGNSGTSQLSFVLLRSGDLTPRIVFDFFTEDGTATAPSDYVSLSSGNQVIASGDTSANAGVSINGDTTPEGDETLLLRLGQITAVGPDPVFGAPTRFDVSDPLQTIAVANHPYSIALVDFNGDGRLDVVTGNLNSNEVAVRINTTVPGATTPSFAAPIVLNSGAGTLGVAGGDFDGDGRPDLVATITGGNVYVNGAVLFWRNTTTPGATTASFASAISISEPNRVPYSVKLADINGDGRLDAVFFSEGEFRARVLLNATPVGSTTLTFTDAGGPNMDDARSHVLIADFNGDGRPDIAASGANEPGYIAVSLNNTVPGASTVTFGTAQSFLVGLMPFDDAVVDFNGDGKPDIAVATKSEMSFLLNTTVPGSATVTFAPLHSRTDYPSLFAIDAADVNGDGRPDPLTVNLVAANRAVFFPLTNSTPPGSASARFTSANGTYIGGSVWAMAVGDINGDGRPDVVMANNSADYDGFQVSLNTTVFYPNLPTFASSTAVGAGNNPSAVAASDLNGDGKPDLVAANGAGNSVTVLLNATANGSSTATFATAATFAAGTAPSSVALADLNGDGVPDIALANQGSNNVSTLINTTVAGAAATSCAGASNFAAGSSPTSLVLADLNGDGRRDLIVANAGSNNVSVLFNNTTPGATAATLSSATSFSVGTTPRSVAAGDLNGDGVADVVVANQAGNTASVLLNTTSPGAASPSFATATSLAVAGGPVSIALGDINGDGKLDIATANSNGNSATVFLNTTAAGATTASFASAVSFAAGSGPSAIVLRDIDHDGRLDLLVADQAGNTVAVLLNTTAPGATSPSFASATTFAVPAPAALATSDLNGDGQLELVAANANGVAVLMNTLYSVRLLHDSGTGTILDDDGDHTPNAFGFPGQSGVATNTLIVSAEIAISGINAPTSISVLGGEYSINGAAFTSAAGTISNGQLVRVRHMSASAANTATTTTLTAGGITGTFTSTTAAAGGTTPAGGGGGVLTWIDGVMGLVVALAARRSRARLRRFGARKGIRDLWRQSNKIEVSEWLLQ